MKKQSAGSFVTDSQHWHYLHSRRAPRWRFGIIVALVALAASVTVSSCGSAQGLASGSPTSAATPAGSQDVSLTWNPSASSGVFGYNVYRASGSGGPFTKLNTATLELTRFTDTTIQTGQTYYYVVTATGSDNIESVYSNEIVVPVP